MFFPLLFFIFKINNQTKFNGNWIPKKERKLFIVSKNLYSPYHFYIQSFTKCKLKSIFVIEWFEILTLNSDVSCFRWTHIELHLALGYNVAYLSGEKMKCCACFKGLFENLTKLTSNARPSLYVAWPYHPGIYATVTQNVDFSSRVSMIHNMHISSTLTPLVRVPGLDVLTLSHRFIVERRCELICVVARWYEGCFTGTHCTVQHHNATVLSFLSSENMGGMFSAAMADILVFKQNLSSRDWHQSELGDGCDLQLVLWHATWRSDAVVHASVYTGSRWGKTKPFILLLYCEISMTLLTLPPSLDLSFKATYLHRVRMFFFFFRLLLFMSVLVHGVWDLKKI